MTDLYYVRTTKTTPKWAWPGSHDPISKFWDPLITFERIEQSASNLVQTSHKGSTSLLLGCLWTIKTPRYLSVNSPELFFGLFRVRVRVKVKVRVRIGVRVNSVTETNYHDRKIIRVNYRAFNR